MIYAKDCNAIVDGPVKDVTIDLACAYQAIENELGVDETLHILEIAAQVYYEMRGHLNK